LKKDQILHEAAIKNAGMQIALRPLCFLVPLDFNDHTSHALGYVLHLAKVYGGSIRLVHAVDMDNLPVSENPLTLNHAIRNLTSRASQKLKAYHEIIVEQGVAIRESKTSVGSMAQVVEAELQKNTRDLVVLGSDPISLKLLIRLRSMGNLNVLMVPQNVQYNPPENFLMLSDGLPIAEARLDVFARMVEHGSGDITVLDTRPVGIKRLLFKYKLPISGRSISFTRKFQVVQANKNNLNCVILQHNPDLICRVIRSSSWLQRLMSWASASLEIGKDRLQLLIIE